MKVYKDFCFILVSLYFCSTIIFAQENNYVHAVKNKPIYSNSSDVNLILYNANILTFDDNLSNAQAVAISDEHIYAIGTNDDILAMQNVDTRLINLNGRTVLPGLIEAHSHRLQQAYYANGIDGVKQIAEEYAKDGFTTVHELTINDTGFIDALETLANTDQLAVRVNLYLCGNDNCNGDSDIWRQYPITENKEAKVRIIGVKLFSDGGTCGMYPALSLPYIGSGAAGTFGNLFRTQEEMNPLVGEIIDAGYPIAMHAIGDAGAQVGLNAFETAFDGNGNQLRCRIEHLRFLSDDMIEQMSRLGIGAGIQYTWARADRAGSFESTYDANLLPNVYRWKDLIDADVKIIGGNDFPYTTLTQAMQTISLAVTRKSSQDETLVSWLENQNLTVEQALYGMTINNAWAAFEENVKGTITVGKLADLTILSDNPFTVDPFDIRNIEIDMTIMGGVIRHNNLRIPEYAIHDAADVSFVINDDGSWGKSFSFWGMKYNNYEHMYSGSLILSYDDNTIATSIIQYDFATSPGGWIEFNEPGDFADEEATVVYEDYISAHPRQIQIVQQSYMWADHNYLLIPFNIKNNGQDIIDDVRVGFWADFDTGNPSNNLGQWKSDNAFNTKFAYIYDPDDTSAPYVGMTIINHDGDCICGTVKFEYLGFYQWMEGDVSAKLRSNVIQNFTEDRQDLGLLVGSSNIFYLQPGYSTDEFNLIIALGSDEQDLQTHFNNAVNNYKIIKNNSSQNAVRFSAPGDYIEITDNEALNPSQITVELFLKVRDPYLSNQAGGEQNLIDKRDGDAGYNLRICGTEYPLDIQAKFGEQNIALAENVIEQNVWYHAAVTQDGTEVKLYLNGNLVASSVNSNGYDPNSESNLRIGEFLGYPGSYLGLSGDIDELSMWNYAKSQEQISGDIYNDIAASNTGLIGYWNFNSISIAGIDDLSYSGNNGIVHGNIRLVNFDKRLFTDIEDENNFCVPEECTLFQNYPNPFNPRTLISYSIPEQSKVNLTVYDILGRKVAALVNGIKNAGNHKIKFNAKCISSGIYFYQLNVNGNLLTKKMIVLK